MLKKIGFSVFILLTFNEAISQERNDQQEPFYINLFIAADKTIFVENDKTHYKEVKGKVVDMIRRTPFKLN